jgi:hypothetical protein
MPPYRPSNPLIGVLRDGRRFLKYEENELHINLYLICVFPFGSTAAPTTAATEAT